jgi:poly(A)-specific ribonuclease
LEQNKVMVERLELLTCFFYFQQSNDLIANIPNASYIAIDEEMTGISPPNAPRPPKDDTPSQRYLSLKTVPERYSIIQFGVALFMKRENDDGFDIKKYNFYLFPNGNCNSREVTLNPSSIAFLKDNDMDFNTWTKEGITFCTSDQATEYIQKYREKVESIMEDPPLPKPSDPTTRSVELTRPDDINFHAGTMASLREWIDSARTATEEGTSLILPPANSFLRRALYESIGKEYPSLTLEKHGSNQIRVLRMTADERKVRRQRKLLEAWEWLMIEELGFWRVFSALSHANQGLLPIKSLAHSSSIDDVSIHDTILLKPIRKVPMVVHNGLMDLLFLLSHCHSYVLPETYMECKGLISKYFPLVYDTKVMASEGVNRHDATVLSQLFTSAVPEEIAADFHFAEDSTQASAHEASHDAFMTGAVFYGLCLSATHPDDGIYPWNYADQNHQLYRERYSLNKLYLMLTMYTIDLENPMEDPLSRGMHIDTTYRVTGSDPSITTRDIVRCLTSLTSPFPNTRLHFEIVWVDDVTFLVAARNDGNTDRLMIHGAMIETALRHRFPSSAIIGLKQYLESKQIGVDETKKRKPWSIWKWLGFENDDGGEDRPSKRRRTD